MSLQNKVLELRVIYDFAITSISLLCLPVVMPFAAARRRHRPRAAPPSTPPRAPLVSPKTTPFWHLLCAMRVPDARRRATPPTPSSTVVASPSLSLAALANRRTRFRFCFSSRRSLTPQSPKPCFPHAQSPRRRPLTPPQTARRGAPFPDPPPPEIDLGIGPPPHPEALQPVLAAPPSPERRLHGTGPPPAVAARGQPATGHLSLHRDHL